MLNWLRRPDAKELGNSAFKEKNLDEAVLQYTRGLERCQGTAQTEERSKLLANRSAAHAKLGDFEAALADAEEASRLQPDWPKAWARKGTALACLQWHKAAASSSARAFASTCAAYDAPSIGPPCGAAPCPPSSPSSSPSTEWRWAASGSSR